MKKYRFHVKAAMLGTLLLTFPACEGLFDDIYDNPSEANLSTNGFGFVEVSPETHSGTLYVNSSDYTQWSTSTAFPECRLHASSMRQAKKYPFPTKEHYRKNGTLPFTGMIPKPMKEPYWKPRLKVWKSSWPEKKFRRETIPPTHRKQRIRLPLTFQTCITERSDTHVLTTIPSFPNGSREKVCLPLIPCRAKSMSSG